MIVFSSFLRHVLVRAAINCSKFIKIKIKRDAMKINTKVRAGELPWNHNEKIAVDNFSNHLKEISFRTLTRSSRLPGSKERFRFIGQNQSSVRTSLEVWQKIAESVAE